MNCIKSTYDARKGLSLRRGPNNANLVEDYDSAKGCDDGLTSDIGSEPYSVESNVTSFL